jgi:hypothetical protein
LASDVVDRYNKDQRRVSRIFKVGKKGKIQSKTSACPAFIEEMATDEEIQGMIIRNLSNE